MIRVLMLDLGDTLVRGDKVLPHVSEALDVLTRFETKSTTSLILSLVSDYDMPTLPKTPQKINAIFNTYVAMLDKLHLKTFFEPVERRVTLQLMPEFSSLILLRNPLLFLGAHRGTARATGSCRRILAFSGSRGNFGRSVLFLSPSFAARVAAGAICFFGILRF